MIVFVPFVGLYILLSLYYFKKNPSLSVFILLCLFSGILLLPLSYYPQTTIKTDNFTFVYYFNQTIVGIILLAISGCYRNLFLLTKKLAVLYTITVILLAIGWHKHGAFYSIYLLRVFFNAAAEEMLFRFLIQDRIQKSLTIRYKGALAVLVSSILFGMAHFRSGDVTYMLLAGLAGLVYGTVYLKTKNIENAIFIHTFVNILRYLRI